MANFFMRPIEPATRLRDAHDTKGIVLSSWQPENLIECDVEWVAPVDLFLMDAAHTRYQKAGDRWGHVVKIDSILTTGENRWMAIVNQGLAICEIVEAPAPPAPDSPFVAARL